MMNEPLNVPPEIQHLIEKRENEDRRKEQRRGSTEDHNNAPSPDDGSTPIERRGKSDRRTSERRATDE